jgi:hypothetical protein
MRSALLFYLCFRDKGLVPSVLFCFILFYFILIYFFNLFQTQESVSSLQTQEAKSTPAVMCYLISVQTQKLGQPSPDVASHLCANTSRDFCSSSLQHHLVFCHMKIRWNMIVQLLCETKWNHLILVVIIGSYYVCSRSCRKGDNRENAIRRFMLRWTEHSKNNETLFNNPARIEEILKTVFVKPGSQKANHYVFCCNQIISCTSLEMRSGTEMISASKR